MARLGESDCERARQGVLTQRINALTSLAFVPAGLLAGVAARRTTGSARLRIAAYAAALAGVGLGSFAYHGPQPAWAGRAHDGSIALALACALLVRSGVDRRRNRMWRSGPGRVAAALIAAAVPAYVGGRTGSPLCDPDSAVQLHGAWHVLTAAAAVAFARAAAVTNLDVRS